MFFGHASSRFENSRDCNICVCVCIHTHMYMYIYSLRTLETSLMQFVHP